jgi:hypothetical protein
LDGGGVVIGRRAPVLHGALNFSLLWPNKSLPGGFLPPYQVGTGAAKAHGSRRKNWTDQPAGRYSAKYPSPRRIRMFLMLGNLVTLCGAVALFVGTLSLRKG